MAYQCIDCSYKGNKFVSGSCPACGSNNVRREKTEEPEEQKKAGSYRMIFAVGLWLIFFVELYKKLF